MDHPELQNLGRQRTWARLAKLWRYLHRRELRAWDASAKQSSWEAQRPWLRRHDAFRALRLRVESERSHAS